MNHFNNISDYQDFDVRIKINGFSIEDSFTGVRFSFETFLEEIMPIVREIYDFQFRQKSTK